MKFFSRAKIYLVGKQVLTEAESKRFLEDEGTSWLTDTLIDGEKIPEMAGRVCYMSFGDKQGRKSNKDYLGHILEVGHGSVLEHTVFNFIFTGVSRSLTHELIRHRAGFGYSQLSQRYVDERDASFVIPPAMQGDADLEQAVRGFCENTSKLYAELTDKLADKYTSPKQLVDFALREEILIAKDGGYAFVAGHGDAKPPAGVKSIAEWATFCESDKEANKYFKKATLTARRKTAREAARCVLPNATETKVFVTANARGLRHFIELRGDIHAEAEIRALACDVCRLMIKEAPNLFGDYEVVKLPDGSERTRTKFRKV
jgi:thymidylate synthase (FAD)